MVELVVIKPWEVERKGSSTAEYILASAHMFKSIHDFDNIDFSNLYSNVHNPISFSIWPLL